MSDIVERLRGSLLLGSDPKLHLLRNSDIAEAANEIDRLQFEYERADEAARRLGTKWKEGQAEIERLRAALHSISESHVGRHFEDPAHHANWCVDAARRAMEGK